MRAVLDGEFLQEDAHPVLICAEGDGALFHRAGGGAKCMPTGLDGDRLKSLIISAPFAALRRKTGGGALDFEMPNRGNEV